MVERVALVIGAGRGLGQVMALTLLRVGHRVFLTSTDMASLEETRRAGGANERTAIATTDLGDESSLPKLVATAERAFGRVDILINNAGIPNPSAEELDTVLKSGKPAGEDLKKIVQDHTEACDEIKEKLEEHKADKVQESLGEQGFPE